MPANNQHSVVMTSVWSIHLHLHTQASHLLMCAHNKYIYIYIYICTYVYRGRWTVNGRGRGQFITIAFHVPGTWHSSAACQHICTWIAGERVASAAAVYMEIFTLTYICMDWKGSGKKWRKKDTRVGEFAFRGQKAEHIVGKLHWSEGGRGAINLPDAESNSLAVWKFRITVWRAPKLFLKPPQTGLSFKASPGLFFWGPWWGKLHPALISPISVAKIKLSGNCRRMANGEYRMANGNRVKVAY